VIPTWLTVVLLAAGAVAALLAGGEGRWWPVLLGFDAALVLLAVVDARWLVAGGAVRAVRRTERVMSLGVRNRVELVLSNVTGRPLRVHVVEPLTERFEPSTVDLGTVVIGPRQSVTLSYGVRPLARGRHALPPTGLRVRGPLRLALRPLHPGAPHEVRVYPDVKTVGRYQSLIRRSRLREMGISPVRQRGEGMEFESLRDYVPGDDPSRVDWKATARRAKLISRNYETERSQTIMICLDAGRMMATRIGGLSRFDHAVNSALLLAHVALGRGDNVGLVVFGEGILRYLPPRKTSAYLRRIVEALYDVEPRLVEPSFRDAVTRAAIGRRRSLMVMFTDVSDEESAAEMVPYVNRLLPRHLPLMILMRDREVLDRAEGVGEEGARADPWQMAAAAQLLEERERVMETMRSRGSLVVDVDPGALAPRVINAYLEVKARSMI
jgi:uncharacterized protein (DUF58 family)